MPGSRQFTINTIRNHLPETTKEVELEKWEKISYLLQTEIPKNEEEISRNKSISEIKLLEFRSNQLEENSLHKSLCEGALLIKEYIKAEFSDVYLVKEDHIHRLLYKHGCPSIGSSWPVGPGTVTSAYVAFMGQTLVLDDIDKNNHLYPFGTGRQESTSLHLISTPVLIDNGGCEFVFEFGRIANREVFSKAETRMCVCMVGWLGQSLTIKKGPYAAIVDCYEALFSVFRDFQHIHEDPDKLITDTLVLLHKAVPMVKVNYYKIIEGQELRCRMYAQTGKCNWQCSPEYILKGLIKKVVENHMVKNMSKDEIDFLEEPLKIQFKGIHSYMCVPIGITTSTKGVVELINKKNSESFVRKDIEEATRFGILCAVGIHYSELYIKKQRAYFMCENQNLTFLHHLHPCPHDLELVKYKLTNLTIPPSFFKLTYYPAEEELQMLILYTWYIFHDVFQLHESDETINKFLTFIMNVRQGYRDVSYHNFEHAFNVCHCMYIITSNNSDVFSNLEKRALIVAGICHDIDHPAVTNKFIKDSGHKLTKLYNESFLENHHSSMCRMLVQNCGIFSDLSSQEYQSVVKMINYSILATDLSNYFSVRYKLMDILTNNSFNIKERDHKCLLTDIIMTSCDLSGQSKTFRVAERLCRNLLKEFYSESDRATALGIQPLYVMERTNNYDIPKFQVQFMSEICLPCFYILSTILKNTKELHNQSCDICEKWDQIQISGKQWDVLKEEYVYHK